MAKINVWVTGSEVCKVLGISSKHLARLRKSKTLIKGKHYKNIGRKMALRPTYRYNLSRIRDDLS